MLTDTQITSVCTPQILQKQIFLMKTYFYLNFSESPEEHQMKWQFFINSYLFMFEIINISLGTKILSTCGSWIILLMILPNMKIPEYFSTLPKVFDLVCSDIHVAVNCWDCVIVLCTACVLGPRCCMNFQRAFFWPEKKIKGVCSLL